MVGAQVSVVIGPVIQRSVEVCVPYHHIDNAVRCFGVHVRVFVQARLYEEGLLLAP